MSPITASHLEGAFAEVSPFGLLLLQMRIGYNNL